MYTTILIAISVMIIWAITMLVNSFKELKKTRKELGINSPIIINFKSKKK